MRTPILFTLAFASVAVVGGCKDPNSIENQAKAIKGMPPPTKEQLARGYAELAANFQKAKDEQSQFAKTHSAADVAKINAERAAAGKPPLGQ